MKRSRMYYVWRFLQYFCLEYAKLFESCAEHGFWETFKAEYMHNVQSNGDQIDGSVQDPSVDQSP